MLTDNVVGDTLCFEVLLTSKEGDLRGISHLGSSSVGLMPTSLSVSNTSLLKVCPEMLRRPRQYRRRFS